MINSNLSFRQGKDSLTHLNLIHSDKSNELDIKFLTY